MKAKQNTKSNKQIILRINCCFCKNKLTLEENIKNSTYDPSERMCDKCLNDPDLTKMINNIR